MNILLIDTSSNIIEFGYANDGKLLIYKRLPENENADTLIYFIKTEFDNRKINNKDIDIVSLSNGPGSFTGLRIGSAISKGICFANNCKLIEVNTLDLIANKYKLLFNVRDSDKNISSVIFSNMRTKEHYICTYKIENGKLIRISDYLIDNLENYDKNNQIFVTNDVLTDGTNNIISLAHEGNIQSQLELSIEMIDKNAFSDPETSKPFYLKEFIPLGKK